MGIYSVNYNTYDKQKAAAYIAYMIAGSYFKKTEPAYSAGSWKLHYAQMNEQRRYECEEQADGLMEQLGEEFLGNISSLRCEIRTRKKDSGLEVRFCTGGFEEVVCTITEAGRLGIRAVPGK